MYWQGNLISMSSIKDNSIIIYVYILKKISNASKLKVETKKKPMSLIKNRNSKECVQTNKYKDSQEKKYAYKVQSLPLQLKANKSKQNTKDIKARIYRLEMVCCTAEAESRVKN